MEGDQSISKEGIKAISKEVPVYKIVLTGGPCGGKTTALARLSYYLRERGFEVMTSPEAFSILATNGFSLGEHMNIKGMPLAVQNTVLDVQTALEDGLERLLRACGKPGVVLCDRGLMDGKAYISDEEWKTILRNRNLKSDCNLREGRYNAVFHLVTAAEGAEKYYTLSNNESRTETVEEARKIDNLTRDAWLGHPKLHVIDNSTNFEGKLQRLVESVAGLVGLPSDLPRETTKFLLRSEPDLNSFTVPYQVFDVEKVYLYDNTMKNVFSREEYAFIRKRSHENGLGTVYGITTVNYTNDGQKIELKRIIKNREYFSLLMNRDPNRFIIQQTRISFLYDMQSFTIHLYKEPIKGICLLHAQSSHQENLRLPPFLDVQRKLLNNQDEKYSSYFISQKEK